MKLGQPPRSYKGDFDKRELERWFEDIYRQMNIKTETVTEETTPTETVTNITYGGGSSTTIIYNAKRYLRWMQL